VNNRQTSLDTGDEILDILNLLLGGIIFLVLAEFAGEEDETGAVLL
jgi:hypothetical protein